MAYEKPKLTLNQVDRVGKRLTDPATSSADFDAALAALNDWRSAHGYPLNALHMTLRNRATSTDPRAITAQRLKRYASILRKLLRRPTMQLSQMQDMGGCRAIVSRSEHLRRLVALYESSPLRHEARPPVDYIQRPKDDGYRGVHLMYRFSGKGSSLPWDRLRIEIQIRTALQHSWSTAVETVDAFTGQDLKFGGGQRDWRRFFALMGTVHAAYEKGSPVPGTCSHEGALHEELEYLERKLNVLACLRSYSTAAKHIDRSELQSASWYVMELLPTENRIEIHTFQRSAFEDAKAKAGMLEAEYEGSNKQAVLVSAHGIKELKKAYPNYFADTQTFARSLSRFLEGTTARPRPRA